MVLRRQERGYTVRVTAFRGREAPSGEESRKRKRQGALVATKCSDMKPLVQKAAAEAAEQQTRRSSCRENDETQMEGKRSIETSVRMNVEVRAKAGWLETSGHGEDDGRPKPVVICTVRDEE